MKKIKKLAAIAALIIIILPILGVRSYAKTHDELLSEFSAAVPDKYKDDITPEGLNEKISLSELLKLLGSELSGSSGKIGTLLLFTLGICALSLLASAYQSKLSSSMQLGIMSISISALALQIAPVISAAASALNEATAFFSSVIPTLCAINASGGGVATANTQGLSMSLTVGMCSAVTSRVLPFVASVIYSLDMLGALGLDGKIARSAKNLYAKILGAVTIIITLIFSFQSIVSSAGDSVAIRTAKYGVANLIPIVGSTVSSSLGLLSGGLSYVKSITGVGSVLVLAYILISPLVLLLLYKLVLSLSASLESAFGGVGIIAPSMGIIDCVIASYSLCSVLYIFEIVIFMRYGLVL